MQRGIAEKKSVAELAADLEQYVKAPAKRDFDWGKVYPSLSGKKVDFNAQRLARTSINHAYFLDNVKVCTENPFVESMHWDLSNAHDERQVIPFGPDECDEYAEHDEGLGLGNFKPEEIPVPHPQCLCVQWAVIPDSLEDIGARIGAWASGEPDELLDEWYDKYGNRNPNGDPKEILREGLKFEGKGGIIKTEIKSPTIHAIEQPIEQRNTGKGKPTAILIFDVELNNRQTFLLNSLPHYDSRITVPKRSVNMTDLAALTAKTGHEFAMFTKGQERLIIRGDEKRVNIHPEDALELAKAGYRWSGHTHPGTTNQCMIASGGDMLVLEQFSQSTSVIYNSKGQFATFDKEE